MDFRIAGISPSKGALSYPTSPAKLGARNQAGPAIDLTAIKPFAFYQHSQAFLQIGEDSAAGFLPRAIGPVILLNSQE